MTFLLIDTETTGLFDYRKRAHEPGQPRMCSIAAILVDDKGKEVDSFYHLVNPRDWDEQTLATCGGAFAINGLSLERLRAEGTSLRLLLAGYDQFLRECDGVAAFGVEFDTKVLRGELRRAGRPDRYGARPVFCINEASTEICRIAPTDRMMMAGIRGFKKPKLAEAVEIILGESLEGAHDAMVDLRATARIFAIMLARGMVEWRPQTKAPNYSIAVAP
jgi:DNA polymerase-3 subunit epsilon